MPKIKTKKSLSKRIFRITKSGKVIRKKITSQHLCHRKSKRVRKGSGNKKLLHEGDSKLIQLTPYK